MKTASSFYRIAIIAAMAVFVGSASAQDRDIGKIEYQSNCASLM